MTHKQSNLTQIIRKCFAENAVLTNDPDFDWVISDGQAEAFIKSVLDELGVDYERQPLK